jgi:phosphatidate cytidylyltransferase
MKLRIISSIIGLPIAIFAVGYGGNLLLVLLAFVALIGLFEFYRAFNVKQMDLKSIGYVMHVGYYLLLVLNLYTLDNYLITLFLMVLLIFYVFKYPKYPISSLISVFFGFFYVSYLFSHIYLVRQLPTYGEWIVWLIFISAWGSDTFAYATGLTLGKHKLAPVLSPKKTIEGSIGGVFGAVLLSGFYGLAFVYFKNETIDYIYYFTLIGGVASVLSQIGDLAASAIKRNVSIKDFGHLIPGHGGILDRFDSIIFTAPFVYLIASLFLLN